MTAGTEPGGTGPRPLRCSQVGSVLIVQPEGADQPGLQSLAAGLAADPAHTVVVLSPAADQPSVAWEPVLPVLARCPGGLRLVPGSPALTSTVTLGQWLVDRLDATVLAQDGAALTTTRGGLFIPVDSGDGWLELSQDRPAALASRRFPAPGWSGVALEESRLLGPSGAVVAEPVPGGAWIHPAGPDDALAGHRQRLTSWLAWREDQIYLPLGCPGTAPVDLADITQFWRLLPPQVRAAVRFVPYGPVLVPDGEALGQALASRFGEPVTICTGLPYSGRAPSDPIAVRALHQDGSPGWLPYATELGFAPGLDGPSPPPAVRSHRPPVAGLTPVLPGTYAFEPGILLEVVPSGLWLRGTTDPDGPDIARSYPLSPDEPIIFVSTASVPAKVMSSATNRLVDSLDSHDQVFCRILESGPLAPAAPAPAPSTGPDQEFGPVPEPEADFGPDTVLRPEPDLAAEPNAAPGWPASPLRTALPAEPVPPAAPIVPAAPVPPAAPLPPVEPNREDAPAPARPSGAISADGGTQAPFPSSAAVPPPGWPVPPAATPAPGPPAALPSIRLESGPRREPGQVGVSSLNAEIGRLATGSLEGLGQPGPENEPGLLAGGQAGPDGAGPTVVVGPVTIGPAATGGPPLDPGRLVSPDPAGDTAPTAESGPGAQVQPVPSPEACVRPPARGIAQERAWLRRTLSRQYDAAASLVGRVLAENPGLRAGAAENPADLLTDLVALRLYLSGTAQQLDDAVRGGTIGPHVPFGRCVAAGLDRLPSYRGATRLRATLADPEWQWYRKRHVVTEWAFCAAQTSGRHRLTGTVEFRIWSMTGRRTTLLEQRVPGQVLFLPGTNFKVLQVNDDGHREVLMRELSVTEIGADGQIDLSRVPLDDLALNGLERAATAWQQADADEELPAGYQHRFGNPPGLILQATASAPDASASGKPVTA